MEIQQIPMVPLTNKDGMITDEWRDWFSRLAQQLQLNLSEDGYSLPQRQSADVNQLTGPNFLGNILYDAGRNVAVININGALASVNTTPL
jgi:hypothetical protein